MPRPAPAFVRQLRRDLADKGLTLRPVCPRCRQQHAPRDFTLAGICRGCAEAEDVPPVPPFTSRPLAAAGEYPEDAS